MFNFISVYLVWVSLLLLTFLSYSGSLISGTVCHLSSCLGRLTRNWVAYSFCCGRLYHNNYFPLVEGTEQCWRGEIIVHIHVMPNYFLFLDKLLYCAMGRCDVRSRKFSVCNL